MYTLRVLDQLTRSKLCRDPSVKRTLCKGCNIVLIPGSTAIVRVKCTLASIRAHDVPELIDRFVLNYFSFIISWTWSNLYLLVLQYLPSNTCSSHFTLPARRFYSRIIQCSAQPLATSYPTGTDL